MLLDWEDVLPWPSPDTFVIWLTKKELVPVFKEVGSFLLEGPGLLLTVATKDSLSDLRSRSIWWKVPKDSMSDMPVIYEQVQEVLQVAVQTVKDLRSTGASMIISLDTSEAEVTLMNELPNTTWGESVEAALRNKEGWSILDLRDHLDEDELPLLAGYRERVDLFLTVKQESMAPLLWASAGLAGKGNPSIPPFHLPEEAVAPVAPHIRQYLHNVALHFDQIRSSSGAKIEDACVFGEKLMHMFCTRVAPDQWVSRLDTPVAPNVYPTLWKDVIHPPLCALPPPWNRPQPLGHLLLWHS